MSEFLPISLVAALLLVSVLAIVRRNGSGSREWQVLVHDIREERDMWRDLAIERGEQLAREGISPVSATELETLSALATDIQAKFSMDEMKTLALTVGVNPESLQQDTSGELARELVMSANRRNRLERLIAEMHKERPEERMRPEKRMRHE